LIIRAGQLATVLLGVEHLELSGRFVLVESLIDHRGQANLLDVLFLLTQTSWPFLNTLRIHAKKHDIFNPSPASCIVCAVCADQMDAQSGSCGKFGGSSCSSGRLLSEVENLQILCVPTCFSVDLDLCKGSRSATCSLGHDDHPPSRASPGPGWFTVD